MERLDIRDLKRLHPNDLANIKGHAVVTDYDELFNIGIIVENNLAEKAANEACEYYNMAVTDKEFIVKSNDETETPVKITTKYCEKCGGSGILFGEICTCRFNSDTFFSDVVCLNIPEQYRNLHYSEALVPNDVDISYGKKLSEMYTGISTARIRNHNYLLCSPHRHSKTILAYSCIDRLFKAGLPVVPVYDIMELRKVMRDYDNGKNSFDNVKNPEDILTVPYLFVKIPSYPTWETYDTLDTLVSRRVRRGGSTILMYSGRYSNLLKNDSNDLLVSMRGDGSFNSLEILEWQRVNKFEEE